MSRRNYIEKKELHDAIRESQETGHVSEKLHMMFWTMSHEIIKGKRFCGYTDDWKEDMVSTAYVKCVTVYKKFDLAKPDAFSYFTSVITNSFKDVIKYENRQIEIKKRNYAMMTGEDKEIYKQ